MCLIPETGRRDGYKQVVLACCCKRCMYLLPVYWVSLFIVKLYVIAADSERLWVIVHYYCLLPRSHDIWKSRILIKSSRKFAQKTSHITIYPHPFHNFFLFTLEKRNYNRECLWECTMFRLINLVWKFYGCQWPGVVTVNYLLPSTLTEGVVLSITLLSCWNSFLIVCDSFCF